jgi:hypothetical protein
MSLTEAIESRLLTATLNKQQTLELSLHQGFLTFLVPWTPLVAWWSLWNPSQNNVFKCRKKIHRITKETNYTEIHLSNVKKEIAISCGLFPIFLVEGNAKFQLEISENKDVTFFPPIQVHGPLEIYPRSVDPRLRTPGLHSYILLL